MQGRILMQVLLHIYSLCYSLDKINIEEGHLPSSSNSLMSFGTAAAVVFFFFALQPSLLFLPKGRREYMCTLSFSLLLLLIVRSWIRSAIVLQKYLQNCYLPPCAPTAKLEKPLAVAFVQLRPFVGSLQRLGGRWLSPFLSTYPDPSCDQQLWKLSEELLNRV